MIASDGIHVVSDTSFEELHAWAATNGIKRCHFHRRRKTRWPHYDLPKRRQGLTIPGVLYMRTRELIDFMRNGPMLEELIAQDRVIDGRGIDALPKDE